MRCVLVWVLSACMGGTCGVAGDPHRRMDDTEGDDALMVIKASKAKRTPSAAAGDGGAPSQESVEA